MMEFQEPHGLSLIELGKLREWSQSSSTLAMVVASHTEACHYGSLALYTLLVEGVADWPLSRCRAVLRRWLLSRHPHNWTSWDLEPEALGS